MNPHESLTHKTSLEGESPRKKTQKNERLSSLLGTFIHKVFELSLKGETNFLEDLWNSYVLSSPIFIGLNYSQKKSQALFNETREEGSRTLVSDKFKEFFHDSVEFYSEFPVVSLRGSYLTKGSIDLFIRYKSGDILILDYKTSEVDENEDFFEFCRSRQYDKQLYSYKKILGDIYPEASICGGVWLTKSCEFIQFF